MASDKESSESNLSSDNDACRLEMKIESMKKRYEEELTSFNEARVENIFQNSGAREYLKRLKDRERIKDDMIKSLKKQLELKDEEISDLRNKYRELEKQKINRISQSRKDQLDLDKRQFIERISLADNLGQSLELPKMNQILQETSSFNDSSLCPPIPPPPPPPEPIDVPMGEILGEL